MGVKRFSSNMTWVKIGLEVFGEYDLLHPVNLLWYIPDGIVIYALYKHGKAI